MQCERSYREREGMTVFFLVLVTLLLACVSGLLGAAIRTQGSVHIISGLARVINDTNTRHGAAVMREEAWNDIRLYLGCLIQLPTLWRVDLVHLQ